MSNTKSSRQHRSKWHSKRKTKGLRVNSTYCVACITITIRIGIPHHGLWWLHKIHRCARCNIDAHQLMCSPSRVTKLLNENSVCDLLYVWWERWGRIEPFHPSFHNIWLVDTKDEGIPELEYSVQILHQAVPIFWPDGAIPSAASAASSFPVTASSPQSHPSPLRLLLPRLVSFAGKAGAGGLPPSSFLLLLHTVSPHPFSSSSALRSPSSSVALMLSCDFALKNRKNCTLPPSIFH